MSGTRRLFFLSLVMILLLFVAECQQPTAVDKVQKLTQKDVRKLSKSERNAKSIEFYRRAQGFASKSPENYMAAAHNAYILDPSAYEAVFIQVNSLMGQAKVKQASNVIRKWIKTHPNHNNQIIQLLSLVPSLVIEYEHLRPAVERDLNHVLKLIWARIQHCDKLVQPAKRKQCIRQDFDEVRADYMRIASSCGEFLVTIAENLNQHTKAWEYRSKLNNLYHFMTNYQLPIEPFLFFNQTFSADYMTRVLNDPNYHAWLQSHQDHDDNNYDDGGNIDDDDDDDDDDNNNNKNSNDSLASASPTPVFIVSLPRSGTTLLTKLLTAHSKVVSLGEPDVYHQGSIGRQILKDIAYPQWSEVRTRYYPIQEAALSRELKTQTKKNKIDKDSEEGEVNPSEFMTVDKSVANFFIAPLVLLLHPTAKIIFLRRNILDVAVSTYHKTFVQGGFGPVMDRFGHPYQFNLSQMAEYYGKARILTDHWISIFEQIPALQDRFIQVRYEHVVANVQGELDRLCQFLGLELEEGMIPEDPKNDHQKKKKKKKKKKNEKKVSNTEFFTFTASKAGISESLNTKSLERYKHNLAQLEEFVRTYTNVLEEDNHPLDPDAVRALQELEEMEHIVVEEEQDSSSSWSWF